MAEVIQYKSKVEISYEYILDKIMSLQLKAGDRVVISQIAKECKVSDIPVREALRMLEREGYLTMKANQGAVITGVSIHAIKNMIHVKGVLEAYATRLSAEYLNEEDYAALNKINDMLRRMSESKNVEKFVVYNQEFHFHIYRRLPNEELIGLIRDLWERWGITRSVFSVNPERMIESCAEHDEIIRLLRSKDYDVLEATVRRHKFAGAEGYLGKC